MSSCAPLQSKNTVHMQGVREKHQLQRKSRSDRSLYLKFKKIIILNYKTRLALHSGQQEMTFGKLMRVGGGRKGRRKGKGNPGRGSRQGHGYVGKHARFKEWQ